MIKLILIYMKFVNPLNIVIWPYDYNKFVNDVKSLITTISPMGVFQSDEHKYVVN
jgi:hypothetical protein